MRGEWHSLSAGEVGLGYKTVDDAAVYVALELVDEPGTFLVIWTTTPWTLPSNQYAAVKPEYDYVAARDGDHKLIVAAALRETLAQKIGRELPVEREFKGAELLGKRYKSPLDYYRELYWDKEAELADGTRSRVTLLPDGAWLAQAPIPGAVLAGSFDPLHEGHLELARVAGSTLGSEVAAWPRCCSSSSR